MWNAVICECPCVILVGTSDLKVMEIGLHELIHEDLARGSMLHIVNEEAMDDEVLAESMPTHFMKIVSSLLTAA